MLALPREGRGLMKWGRAVSEGHLTSHHMLLPLALPPPPTMSTSVSNRRTQPHLSSRLNK